MGNQDDDQRDDAEEHFENDQQEDAMVDEVSDGKKKKTPTDFLNSVIGQTVVVKLNSGIDYRGL